MHSFLIKQGLVKLIEGVVVKIDIVRKHIYLNKCYWVKKYCSHKNVVKITSMQTKFKNASKNILHKI